MASRFSKGVPSHAGDKRDAEVFKSRLLNAHERPSLRTGYLVDGDGTVIGGKTS
jgi:hypothetical protein